MLHLYNYLSMCHYAVQDTYVRAVIFPYKEVVPPMSEACQFEAQPHTFISIVKKGRLNAQCTTYTGLHERSFTFPYQ